MKIQVMLMKAIWMFFIIVRFMNKTKPYEKIPTFMAFFKFIKLDRTTVVRLLKRTISCTRTVFILYGNRSWYRWCNEKM